MWNVKVYLKQPIVGSTKQTVFEADVEQPDNVKPFSDGKFIKVDGTTKSLLVPTENVILVEMTYKKEG